MRYGYVCAYIQGDDLWSRSQCAFGWGIGFVLGMIFLLSAPANEKVMLHAGATIFLFLSGTMFVHTESRLNIALYDINLGGNRIETVEVNTFDKLPALKLYSGRLCLERNPLNCCGLEWLRAVDALDELCPGRAICAAPLHVQGVALKDTKGKICL